MARKFLVTGATGFVGYHVAAALHKAGWGEVACLARKTSRRDYLQALGLTLVEGDLGDAESLRAACRGVSGVFHVAADYRLWSKDPQDIIRSNVSGTQNILAAAEAQGVERVVYTSSVSAVGRPAAAGFRMSYLSDPSTRAAWEAKISGDETMTPRHLIGAYKRSKFEAEKVAQSFAKKIDLVIVNPSTPIGAYDVKPTPTGKVILDFLLGKMPGFVETGLNYVDVESVAQGHLLAYEKGVRGERYILGDQNLTLEEFLKKVAALSGKKPPRFKIPYAVAYAAGFFSTTLAYLTNEPPGIPLDGVKMSREMMFYRSQKAQTQLGFRTAPLDQAIHNAIRFFAQSL